MKIPTPNAEVEQPMMMYKKDSENSKPRNNPVAMNSRPSRIQNCAALAQCMGALLKKFCAAYARAPAHIANPTSCAFGGLLRSDK